MPRIEYSELCSYDPATEYRVRRWLELAPRIGDDIFLKLFTHGTQERHSQYLLEGGLDFTLSLITRECQRTGLDLHFSTAWEMRQAVRRSSCEEIAVSCRKWLARVAELALVET